MVCRIASGLPEVGCPSVMSGNASLQEEESLSSSLLSVPSALIGFYRGTSKGKCYKKTEVKLNFEGEKSQ